MPGLLELLLGGGNPQLRLGGEDTPAGGGVLDMLGQRIMQQQMNPQMGGAAPLNAQPSPQQNIPNAAPQGAPMNTPQVSMPQQGGGGLLGALFGGRGGSRGQSYNGTVNWLTGKGYSPEAASLIASNKDMLGKVIISSGSPGEATAFQQRAQALVQAGIDPNSAEGKRYFLTGNLPSDENGGLVSVGENSSLYDKATGKWITPPNAGKDRVSTMTPEEVAQAGLPPGVYQRDANGKITTVGGVRDQTAGFSNEKDLASQYSSDPNIKEYAIVRNNYERIREGAQMGSGAGDIAIIFGYMKMLDPTSVVRENEQATAENAGGVPAQVRNMYNKLMQGDKLPDEVRQMYVDAAGKLYSQVAQNVGDVNKRYAARAGAWGVDPSHFQVVPEEYQPFKTPSPTQPTDYKSKYGLD